MTIQSLWYWFSDRKEKKQKKSKKNWQHANALITKMVGAVFTHLQDGSLYERRNNTKKSYAQ